MPISCSVSLDSGTPRTITSVATVLVQGTPSVVRGMRIRRIQLQSNAVNSTEQMITLQYGVYVSGPATGGLTPTAFPMDDQLRGLYTPSTTFRAVTTSLGAGFVPKYCWQWLNGTPFDTASTPGASRGQHMLDEPSKFPSVWALIMPLQFLAPLQQPFSLTGEVDFDEWD